jgi:hypothetical protein
MPLSLPNDLVGYEYEDDSNVLFGHLDWNRFGDGPQRGIYDTPNYASDSHASEDQQLLGHPQNQFYNEGAPSQEVPAENMQVLHTLQLTPPSNYHPYLDQFLSYDDNHDSGAPVASGSSSSQGGAVRTQRTAPHHLPVYNRPDSPPHTAPTSIQPPLWICRWEGCNDAFSSLEDLKRHVLRSKKKKDEHTVSEAEPEQESASEPEPESEHKLPRGHSKKIRCRWGNCSKSAGGIWRHILSKHLHVKFYCPACDTWKTREHAICP